MHRGRVSKIVLLYFLLTLFLAVSLGPWPSHYKTEITALGERQRETETRKTVQENTQLHRIEKNKSVVS